MSETEKFDVIIIGAGPAGSACAYTLAKEGKEVLVIERADVPGSKNVTGGRLYTYALDLLDPGLWEEAALEREVTHEQIMILDGEQAVTIDYSNPSFNQNGQIPQSYTVLRAVFDEWLAGKAEEMGAMIACGVKVDDLIEKDGRIVGIKAGEDDMYADIVIAADGVNSFMAQKAGLIADIGAHNMGVGVKEIIELPASTIQERFNLTDGEGAARMLLGCTNGIHGGGFLYTNRESISLGCVLMPQEAAQKGMPVHDLLQEMKMHPAIHPLLEGGETVEYGAHLVSEAGYRGIPSRLYREGFLAIGDAVGFVINTGYSIRGIDLAIVSGIAAARAVLSEKPAGPAYMEQLESLKLLPAVKAVDGYHDVLEIPRIYSTYPSIAVDVFNQLFSVGGEVPASIKKQIMGSLKNHKLSVWQLIKDGIRGYRSV
jgi:Dehydrogenases (flavoproteins)